MSASAPSVARRKKKSKHAPAEPPAAAAAPPTLSSSSSSASSSSSLSSSSPSASSSSSSSSSSTLTTSASLSSLSAPDAIPLRGSSWLDLPPVPVDGDDDDDDSSSELSSSSDDEAGGQDEHVSYWQRMRRSLVYSAGTSTLGRQAIIRYLPWETQMLIQALYKLVELDTGSKERAFQVESKLIKFLVKLAIEHEAKKLSYKDLLLADTPLREAFELLIKLFFYYGDSGKRNLRPHFERVEQLFAHVVEIVRGILKRTVRWSPTELARLDKVVAVVGTADFLERIWEHPDAEPPLLDLYDSMLKYTAFHYYSKSSGDLSKPTRDLSKVTLRAARKVAKSFKARKNTAQATTVHGSISLPSVRSSTGDLSR